MRELLVWLQPVAIAVFIIDMFVIFFGALFCAASYGDTQEKRKFFWATRIMLVALLLACGVSPFLDGPSLFDESHKCVDK